MALQKLKRKTTHLLKEIFFDLKKRASKNLLKSRENMASGYVIEKRIQKLKEEHLLKNNSSYL